MFKCLCGKEFPSEKYLRQHFRNYIIKGPGGSRRNGPGHGKLRVVTASEAGVKAGVTRRYRRATRYNGRSYPL